MPLKYFRRSVVGRDSDAPAKQIAFLGDTPERFVARALIKEDGATGCLYRSEPVGSS